MPLYKKSMYLLIDNHVRFSLLVDLFCHNVTYPLFTLTLYECVFLWISCFNLKGMYFFSTFLLIYSVQLRITVVFVQYVHSYLEKQEWRRLSIVLKCQHKVTLDGLFQKFRLRILSIRFFKDRVRFSAKSVYESDSNS